MWKAHHVAGQQALQESPRAHGSTLKMSAPGNGVWWKKVILTSGRSWAQIARHEPQVVIVDPYHRAVGRLRCGGFSKGPVHLAKGRPVDGIVVVALLEAVQDRPEGLLRANMVEALDLSRSQRQPRDGIASIGVVDLDDPLENRGFETSSASFQATQAPAVEPAEEALQGRYDAVRALVSP